MLERFKQKHHVKHLIRYGKANLVDAAKIEEELKELREKLALFLPKNKYNMNELALYWKDSPNHTLASKKLLRGKKDKARITANFVCNVDGSDKLPLWFIGTARYGDNKDVEIEKEKSFKELIGSRLAKEELEILKLYEE